MGQFAVMDGSSEVRTDTLFINCDAVCEWITNPSSTPYEQWWPFLPSAIAEMFVCALQIREAPLSHVIMPANAESIPEMLIRMFESFRRLCFVYDGSEFPDRPDATISQMILECQAENQEVGASVSWFVRAKKVFDAEKDYRG